MISLLLALAAPLAPAPAPADSRSATLKDWALSRCVGRAAGKPFQDDAYKSAAALLEKRDARIDTFNRIDLLIDQYLKRRYTGSVPGSYATLKCLDLYHGKALDDLVSGRSR